MQHVAIGDDVFLAFQPELADIARAGLAGLVSALGTMAFNPIAGAITALASFAGMLVGILFARIAAEFILMVFRINEHLAAIRNRGGM